MPTSNVVFLDEVFKANSAILNSLLTIMNERTYHNGIVKDQTPLLSMIAASNELPIGKNELEALYDRFLLKNSYLM
ncbi:putative 2-component regulator [Photobacterium aphoticum]|uniref:Putative 2-component regulator n=1 Tax=Photobacterium aphoticum TaxID=754436 RepID=A0A090QIU8_9GAMM|nr:putative 2-component regulator [Photobacterium aphoticum]